MAVEGLEAQRMLVTILAREPANTAKQRHALSRIRRGSWITPKMREVLCLTNPPVGCRRCFGHTRVTASQTDTEAGAGHDKKGACEQLTIAQWAAGGYCTVDCSVRLT